MNQTVDFLKEGLMLVVLLSAPALAVAVIAGVVVSILQTLFSVQDQSLPFAVKLGAVCLALLATGRWCAVEVVRLTDRSLQAVSQSSPYR